MKVHRLPRIEMVSGVDAAWRCVAAHVKVGWPLIDRFAECEEDLHPCLGVSPILGLPFDDHAIDELVLPLLLAHGPRQELVDIETSWKSDIHGIQPNMDGAGTDNVAGAMVSDPQGLTPRSRASASTPRSRPAGWPCRRSISSPGRRTSRAWRAWRPPPQPCPGWRRSRHRPRPRWRRYRSPA